MKNLTTNVQIEVEVSPQELAALFWSCDHIEQIKFFNALAEYAPRADFETQLIAVQDGYNSTTKLTSDAVRLLETIRDAF